MLRLEPRDTNDECSKYSLKLAIREIYSLSLRAKALKIRDFCPLVRRKIAISGQLDHGLASLGDDRHGHFTSYHLRMELERKIEVPGTPSYFFFLRVADGR